MAMKCNQCGTLLVPGTRSCPGCGLQFATEVPPDTAAPPPAAPQYGAPPQAPYNAPYGQPPPPQAPYGAAPQYGQPQPYGQPPQRGTAKAPGGNKASRWVAVCLGIAAIARGIGYFSSAKPTPAPTPASPPVSAPVTPAPSDPAQPTGTAGLPGPVAANYIRVDSLCSDFMTINKTAKPDDASWRTQMEGNAHDLKAAADEGQSLEWPANLQDAQTDYRAGLAQISEAADGWPAAMENGDQASAKSCADKFQSGAQEVLRAVRLAQSHSAGT